MQDIANDLISYAKSLSNSNSNSKKVVTISDVQDLIIKEILIFEDERKNIII